MLRIPHCVSAKANKSIQHSWAQHFVQFWAFGKSRPAPPPSAGFPFPCTPPSQVRIFWGLLQHINRLPATPDALRGPSKQDELGLFQVYILKVQTALPALALSRRSPSEPPYIRISSSLIKPIAWPQRPQSLSGRNTPDSASDLSKQLSSTASGALCAVWRFLRLRRRSYFVAGSPMAKSTKRRGELAPGWVRIWAKC